MLGRAGLSRERHVEERTKRLPEVLNGDLMRARAELAKHVAAIQMVPRNEDGKRFYVAEGKWDLLGLVQGDPGNFRTLRGLDLNQRPLGYEPNELPDCSTPLFDT